MRTYTFDVPGTRSATVIAATEQEARDALEQNVPDTVEWGTFEPTGEATLSDVDALDTSA